MSMFMFISFVFSGWTVSLILSALLEFLKSQLFRKIPRVVVQYALGLGPLCLYRFMLP